ncbi:MAG: SAM-dependent methyltransferase [Gammaproteobacteria bacterium]|nr:MAG: SAM-dependent methyltransferase [Gammaproteobacteria bacterium]
MANWWHERHFQSDYGISAFKKALGFCDTNLNALDVGCGAGGRFIQELINRDVAVTGIDVSAEMVKLARNNHPTGQFILADIGTWKTEQKFDFIYAWDSIFHLPLAMQKPVINKLCSLLNQNGILFYSFGNAVGEETDEWLNDIFYYSLIGIDENIISLRENGLSLLHLELDQYPERHVYVIAKKL